MTQPTALEDTTSLLARLAAKPNVESTLILSRADGSIIRTSGLVARTTRDEDAGEDAFRSEPKTTSTATGTAQSAEEIARLTWNVVQASQALVGGVEEGEAGQEAKLVRVRGRRKEIVVVPDAKYLLVVVHATPSA